MRKEVNGTLNTNSLGINPNGKQIMGLHVVGDTDDDNRIIQNGVPYAFT